MRDISHRFPDKHNDIPVVIKELLAGGVAGSFAKTVVAPFDRVKILFQTSNPQYTKYVGTWTGVFKASHEIYQQTGVRGLFQGHSATLLRIFPYAAIKFMAYNRYHRFLMPTKGSETNVRRFLAGSLSGTTSVLFTYPLELIRVRLAYQTRHTSQRHSLMDTIATIYREGSSAPMFTPTPVSSHQQSRLFTLFPLLKFYRGFSVTILGMIPYAGTSFLSWDFLRATVYEADVSPSRGGNLAIGAVSGMLGQTVSYPFEVVRRRMQVGGVTQPDRWVGWKEIVRMVWRGRGWQGFYVGLSIGYIKVVPMTAVSFAVWEEMKRVLDIN